MKKYILVIMLCMVNYIFSNDINNMGQKYVNEIKHAIEKKDYNYLETLLTETYQNEPVFDSLHDSEIGEKYYSLGAFLNELLKNKDWDSLLLLLENGASGFIEDGRSPVVNSYLTKIILLDDTGLLLKFLNAGAKVNVKSYLGNITPDLVYAVKKNSKDTFRTLLDYGVNINEKYVLKSFGEYGSQEKYPIFKIIGKSSFYEIVKNDNVDYSVSEIKTSLTSKDDIKMILKTTTSLVKVEDGYETNESTEYLEYNN